MTGQPWWIEFGTGKRVWTYIVRGRHAAKAEGAVYISSTSQTVNQPDALRLLLDRILDGADVILVTEGDGGRMLLDLAADCLTGLRSRVLRAADVLPSALGVPTSLAPLAGQPKTSVPDDEVLSRDFKGLTVLDETCDRIVLLVSNAHALQLPALRYIQLASRFGAHLRLVFCGRPGLFDALDTGELAWLRTRLTAGLVLALAAPIPGAADTLPVLPSAHVDAAGWAGATALPISAARNPGVFASRPSRTFWLGAGASLALGGAACLMLSMRPGDADGPAVSQQVASVGQPLTPAIPPPEMPAADGAAFRAGSEADPALPGVPAPHATTLMSDGQSADLGSRPSLPLTPAPAVAPGAVITVWSQTKLGALEAAPNDLQPPGVPPGLARSLDRQSVPVVPPRVATAVVGNRARRVVEARVRPAPPPRDDQWLAPQPVVGSWGLSVGQTPRYIGSYAAGADGVRTFRLEP